MLYVACTLFLVPACVWIRPNTTNIVYTYIWCKFSFHVRVAFIYFYNLKTFVYLHTSTYCVNYNICLIHVYTYVISSVNYFFFDEYFFERNCVKSTADVINVFASLSDNLRTRRSVNTRSEIRCKFVVITHYVVHDRDRRDRVHTMDYTSSGRN